MGQNASRQRDGDSTSRRLSRFADFSTQREASRSVVDTRQEEGEQTLLATGTVRSNGDPSQPVPSMATFRRQISAQTAPAPRDSTVTDTVSSTRDEVVYEQEERPLVSMEDLRMGDAPITHITASPMPRQPSVISRLGSRISHRYSSVEPIGNNFGREHTSLRRRSNESLSVAANMDSPNPYRNSVFSSWTNSLRSPPPSRRRHVPISRPIPLAASEDLTPTFDSPQATQQAPSSWQSTTQSPTRTLPGLSRSSRLARVRRSISGPIETLFGQNVRSANELDYQNQNSYRNSRNTATDAPAPDETEYLLPPINVTDPSLNLDDREMFASDEHRARTTFPSTEPSERPQPWAQRLADRAPSVRREGRRVPNLLRGRSSRLIRRDDETPLSRILQMAAAAIAAQLSGSTDALANLEAVGDDHFDGGLNHFVEELNTVAGAGNPPSEDGTSAVVPMAPLNFWRVFRFVSPASEHSSPDAGNEESDPRTVTLVVVGVRSVPSSSIQRDNTDQVESNLDTLLNPALGPTPQVSSRSGGLLRSLNQRARFGRRTSMSGSTPFPHQYDSQRHQRSRISSRGEPLLTTPNTFVDNLLSRPAVMDSDVPNPPSAMTSPTPWDAAHPLRLPTLNRRLSTASAANPHLGDQSANRETNSVSHRHINDNRSASPRAVENRTSSDSAVRQRRRSDSEYARHRDLGSGAARRNGTIDLDGGPVQGRSWLIYVVGTNLPEDHPAFTTPSLFTDNPSYEDMMMLSNILGPAKPPVATSDDVAASGGTFRVVSRQSDGLLRAIAVDGTTELTIPCVERCQICLEEYAPEQIARKLNKCVHMFHQDCVDLWLTTGRNSCPLCRGQGVHENARETEPSAAT